MDLDIEQLLNEYTTWLRKKLTVESNSDYTCIDTPFLNTLNDNIRFYVSQNKNKIVIDDDGETLDNLSMMGINLLKGHRKKELDIILRQFDIHADENHILSVSGDKSEFPQMKQRFIDAVIKVDQLSILKRKNISTMFNEDVYNYFDKNDFGGLANYPLPGQTGNEYKFNYALPKLGKRNQKLIDFQNNLNFNTITTAIYKFNDVTGLLKNPNERIIVYNDEDVKLSKKVINSARKENVLLIPFQNKKELESIKV